MAVRLDLIRRRAGPFCGRVGLGARFQHIARPDGPLRGENAGGSGEDPRNHEGSPAAVSRDGGFCQETIWMHVDAKVRLGYNKFKRYTLGGPAYAGDLSRHSSGSGN